MTDAPKPLTVAERSMLALESIASSGKRIAAALERLSPPPPPVVDLDDRNGDPVVKFSPFAWKGEAMKGQSFSACSAEFLDVYATALEQGAATETNEKYRKYGILDAARARGWADRIRRGWTPPRPAERQTSGARPASSRETAPRATAPRPSAERPPPESPKYPPSWDDPEDPPDLDDDEPPPLA